MRGCLSPTNHQMSVCEDAFYLTRWKHYEGMQMVWEATVNTKLPFDYKSEVRPFLWLNGTLAVLWHGDICSASMKFRLCRQFRKPLHIKMSRSSAAGLLCRPEKLAGPKSCAQVSSLRRSCVEGLGSLLPHSSRLWSGGGPPLIGLKIFG